MSARRTRPRSASAAAPQRRSSGNVALLQLQNQYEDFPRRRRQDRQQLSRVMLPSSDGEGLSRKMLNFELQEARSENATLVNRSERLQKVNDELAGDNENLRRKLRDLRKHVMALTRQTESEKLRETIAQLRGTVAARDQKINALRRREAATTLMELAASRDEYHSEVVRLKRMIREACEAASSKEAELRSQVHLVIAQQRELQSRQHVREIEIQERMERPFVGEDSEDRRMEYKQIECGEEEREQQERRGRDNEVEGEREDGERIQDKIRSGAIEQADTSAQRMEKERDGEARKGETNTEVGGKKELGDDKKAMRGSPRAVMDTQGVSQDIREEEEALPRRGEGGGGGGTGEGSSELLADHDAFVVPAENGLPPPHFADLDHRSAHEGEEGDDERRLCTPPPTQRHQIIEEVEEVSAVLSAEEHEAFVRAHGAAIASMRAPWILGSASNSPFAQM